MTTQHDFDISLIKAALAKRRGKNRLLQSMARHLHGNAKTLSVKQRTMVLDIIDNAETVKRLIEEATSLPPKPLRPPTRKEREPSITPAQSFATRAHAVS